MNIIRYKTEYLEQVISLLKDTPNGVHLPSDVFKKIGKQFENEPNRESLDKLLKKAYTALAIENETLVGMAGMDKDGNIGIFAVINSKAYKRLLDTLYRRADKTEIPHLFVQPFEDYTDIFTKHGYKQMNEGDDLNLIKETAIKERLDLKPEDAKSIELDPHEAIIVEGKRSVLPFFFFGMNCFFMLILTVLSVTKYRNAFAEHNKSYITIFAVLSMFVIALAIFIGYFVRQARLKQQVLSMRVTNGMITSFTKLMTRDRYEGNFARQTGQAAYTLVFITYVYYDENMVKREGEFTHRYRFSGPYFYEGQQLVIAYSADKSYILNKYTIANAQDELDEKNNPSDVIEAVSASKLSAYVPIKATKLYYGHAIGYLIGFVITLVFFLIMGIAIAHSTKRPMLNEILSELLFGMPFYDILGGFAVYSVAIPTTAKRKYRKLLENPNARCTQGKIVHADKTYKSDNKMRFYCEFYDGKQKRSVRVPFRSASNLVRHNKTTAMVVFDETDATVLVRKGVYPDVFTMIYYRN